MIAGILVKAWKTLTFPLQKSIENLLFFYFLII